ncbi:hypothetical protein MMC10_001691 [Thelotrema lepadinum]|nr:hypothetical protein [Thelotrema lepadinum]
MRHLFLFSILLISITISLAISGDTRSNSFYQLENHEYPQGHDFAHSSQNADSWAHRIDQTSVHKRKASSTATPPPKNAAQPPESAQRHLPDLSEEGKKLRPKNSELDDKQIRNGALVNIYFTARGLMQVVGVLDIPAGFYDVITSTVAPSGSNWAGEIAKAAFSHLTSMLMSNPNNDVSFMALRLTPPRIYGLYHDEMGMVPGGPARISTGFFLDASAYIRSPKAWKAFVDAVAAYYNNEGNLVKMAEGALVPIAARSLEDKHHLLLTMTEARLQRRSGLDQICATPIDLRQYFVKGATPTKLDKKATC